ncbi:hypothetical protein [Clostridium sp.]|uniref:hypothetical protein n=1 Tax=Clostridium sp. TaxID=1506 RepID=UPI001A4B8BA1|nr:hypothetical protein [Clostridium sp.]MBK5234333.1 hypothetical protein [Clostridium sp.]
MTFNNSKIKSISDRIMNRAVKSGFNKDQLEDFYVESLLKQTTSPRIKDFIELSYYKGIFKGFQYSDTLINLNIEQKSTNIYTAELEKQNINLTRRLQALNDIVFEIKEPTKNTGKLIQDGKNFLSFRNKFMKNINNALKMAWDNKSFLDKNS